MSKLVKSWILVIIWAIVALAVVGCSNSKVDKAKLEAPTNLKISGSTLSWKVVPNALQYKIDIDGQEYSTVNNSYILSILKNAKTYSVRVKAIGDAVLHTDSDFSEPISYIVLPSKIEVNFVTNCSQQVERQVITKGEPIVEPQSLTKDGYTLEAWYTSDSFDPKDKWNFEDGVNFDTLLYANWLINDSTNT